MKEKDFLGREVDKIRIFTIMQAIRGYFKGGLVTIDEKKGSIGFTRFEGNPTNQTIELFRYKK